MRAYTCVICDCMLSPSLATHVCMHACVCTHLYVPMCVCARIYLVRVSLCYEGRVGGEYSNGCFPLYSESQKFRKACGSDTEWALESIWLVGISILLHIPATWFWLFNFPEHYISHFKDQVNHCVYIAGLLWGLNEIIHGKYLAQCLSHCKGFINVNYYYDYQYL